MTEDIFLIILFVSAMFLFIFMEVMETNESYNKQIELLKGDNYGRNGKV